MPSGKKSGLSSLASDASLLRDGISGPASRFKHSKRSLLSRLSGFRKNASNTKEATRSSTAASTTQQMERKQTQSNLVENLYRAYPAMGTNTRLT